MRKSAAMFAGMISVAVLAVLVYAFVATTTVSADRKSVDPPLVAHSHNHPHSKYIVGDNCYWGGHGHVHQMNMWACVAGSPQHHHYHIHYN